MRKINDFVQTGKFSSDNKFLARSKFETLIEDQMRERGSVPVLDMDTEWVIKWNEDNDTYDFSLTMYGVYVGKRKAREEVCGWSSEKESLVLFPEHKENR